jgi:surface protein
MFSDCELLKKLDLSGWDTSNAAKMSYMFFNCKSLEELDLSHFNTSNVFSMEYMFCFCESLKTLDITNFDTYNVTHISGMFKNCKSLEKLNLSSFKFSENICNFGEILYGLKNLKKLTVSKDIIEFLGKKSIYNKFLGWQVNNPYEENDSLYIDIK